MTHDTIKVTSKKTYDMSDLSFEQIETIGLGLDMVVADSDYIDMNPEIVSAAKNITSIITAALDGDK